MDSLYKIYNATELWQRETRLPSIPTFSESLDSAFGNDGIQLGSITEILGLPGSGKTQICLQLCASVQVPTDLGGLNSEALFIDTNTNFTVTRFKEILSASLRRCEQLLNREILAEDEALSNLHYVNAFGVEKFCAFMHNLHNFIMGNSNVKLIVIDSIAYPFKDDVSLKQRTGLLYRIMADLHKIAYEKQIAVVLTNEMSTRLGLSSGAIVGALGDAWAHRCNKRMLLSTPQPLNNLRHAVLLKSNNSPEAVGKFLTNWLEGKGSIRISAAATLALPHHYPRRPILPAALQSRSLRKAFGTHKSLLMRDCQGRCCLVTAAGIRMLT